jgi:protein-tyrosine-phosphatase
MRRVLFVCTGNTCRSPMAEAMFRAKAADLGIEVKSAGVAAFDGQKASEHAIHALRERGISHDHVSQRLNEELIAWADIVLTMTASHKALVLSFFPQAAEKVFTLCEYVDIGDKDIADPFGGGLEIYQQCADEIEQALERLRLKIASAESTES